MVNKHYLKKATDAYASVKAGKKVYWDSEHGKIEIVKDGPLYKFIGTAVNGGAILFGVYTMNEEK